MSPPKEHNEDGNKSSQTPDEFDLEAVSFLLYDNFVLQEFHCANMLLSC